MAEQAADRTEKRLAELGTAAAAAAPVANYVPAVVAGALLVVSGQLPFGPDGAIDPHHKGKLGGEVNPPEGREAARRCALNVLAQARAALGGGLDRIVRVVRLGGFVNCRPHFADLPLVMNGASDLMVEVFGDAGRHARSTVGVAELPMEAAVEVEAMFEIRP